MDEYCECGHPATTGGSAGSSANSPDRESRLLS